PVTRDSLSVRLHLSSPSPLSTLSLHDALPISLPGADPRVPGHTRAKRQMKDHRLQERATQSLRLFENVRVGGHRLPTRTFSNSRDRKSTRLNSSHVKISYAVFCLKKKKRL